MRCVQCGYQEFVTVIGLYHELFLSDFAHCINKVFFVQDSVAVHGSQNSDNNNDTRYIVVVLWPHSLAPRQLSWLHMRLKSWREDSGNEVGCSQNIGRKRVCGPSLPSPPVFASTYIWRTAKQLYEVECHILCPIGRW